MNRDRAYLNGFALSPATASLQAADRLCNGVSVQEKASQQQKQSKAVFPWPPGSQSFGRIPTETVAVLSSLRPPLSALFASLPTLDPGLAVRRQCASGPRLDDLP